MPRNLKGVNATKARADGVMTGGGPSPNDGQANGRAPRAVPVSDAVPPDLPYGEGGQLAANVADTPPPPGVSDLAHAAFLAHQNYHPQVTPLSAPTERPGEPVGAGAPLADGPTNPLAMGAFGGPDQGVASILAQAAEASGSPDLAALAKRAQAVTSSTL